MQNFIALLQTGIEIQAEAGDTIGTFLLRIPSITRQFIEDEIQTIFLNGSATDDLDTALTGEKPVLAISAAMPGLAGAIFRKDSLHKTLRSAKPDSTTVATSPDVTVRLKLFNSIASQCGEALLQNGIFIDSDGLSRFFRSRPWLLESCKRITLDNSEISDLSLLETLQANTLIHLQCVVI